MTGREPRVAFVLKGYPRVSETFIAQEIFLLEGLGFRIDIYSMKQAREAGRQPIVDQIKAPLTYLPFFGPSTLSLHLAFAGRAMLDHPANLLRALAHAVRMSLSQRKVKPLKRFLQAAWIVGHERLGTKNSPITHLHSHFVHAPTEWTRYISLISGLPYSISAHAKDIYTSRPQDLKDRINHAELLMTCTDFNQNYLQKIPGLQGYKVKKVYHGIDLQKFCPDPQQKLRSESLTQFVSVGRLVEKKGYSDIFLSLKILKDKGLKFSYDIYGAGDQKSKLQALSKELQLDDEIVFHDVTTHPQIIARLKQGGIYLCGSRVTEDGDRDGIPNTVAEAMAMELPVLATNVSGLPELIEDGVSGRLVQEKDPAGFAKALEQMLLDPEATLNLGRAARLRVAKVFDSRQWIEKCADHLKSMPSVAVTVADTAAVTVPATVPANVDVTFTQRHKDTEL